MDLLAGTPSGLMRYRAPPFQHSLCTGQSRGLHNLNTQTEPNQREGDKTYSHPGLGSR